MTFQPGQSGNPSGRAIGSRNKRTLMFEQLLDDDAESVILAALDKAKSGNVEAMRIVLDRLVPRCRERPMAFEIPPIASPADAVKGMAALTAALAAGEITRSEAASLSKMIDRYVRALEATEFEARLTALENETNDSYDPAE